MNLPWLLLYIHNIAIASVSVQSKESAAGSSSFLGHMKVCTTVTSCHYGYILEGP